MQSLYANPEDWEHDPELIQPPVVNPPGVGASALTPPTKKTKRAGRVTSGASTGPWSELDLGTGPVVPLNPNTTVPTTTPTTPPPPPPKPKPTPKPGEPGYVDQWGHMVQTGEGPTYGIPWSPDAGPYEEWKAARRRWRARFQPGGDIYNWHNYVNSMILAEHPNTQQELNQLLNSLGVYDEKGQGRALMRTLNMAWNSLIGDPNGQGMYHFDPDSGTMTAVGTSDQSISHIPVPMTQEAWNIVHTPFYEQLAADTNSAAAYQAVAAWLREHPEFPVPPATRAVFSRWPGLPIPGMTVQQSQWDNVAPTSPGVTGMSAPGVTAPPPLVASSTPPPAPLTTQSVAPGVQAQSVTPPPTMPPPPTVPPVSPLGDEASLSPFAFDQQDILAPPPPTQVDETSTQPVQPVQALSAPTTVVPGTQPTQPTQPGVSAMAVPRGPMVMSSVPTAEELATVPPGTTIQTPLGTVVQGPNGEPMLALNALGRAAYQRRASKLAARFTQTAPPSISSVLGLVAPPIVPGRPYFDPFTGEWGVA